LRPGSIPASRLEHVSPVGAARRRLVAALRRSQTSSSRPSAAARAPARAQARQGREILRSRLLAAGPHLRRVTYSGMSVARALARAFTGALLALPLACLQIGSSIETNHTELIVAGMALECPVGPEGCPCTAGGGCDPGLTCVSGICSYGDGDYGSVVYEFEDDIAVEYAREAPPAPAPTKEYRQVSRKAGRADRPQKRRDKLGKSTATSGAAAPEAAPVGVQIVDVAGNQGPGDPAVSTELENLGRQVIYTATLQAAVFDRDAAIALAESLPERWGGWIDSRYDYQITLRVPAERLFEAIELIAELGVVLGKTLQADDV